MMGLRLFGLRRVALTFALIYLAASALTLITSSSYELLLGLKDFLQGFELREPIIMDKSAKSVYTSILPARLAKDLNTVLDLNAKPITATLGYIDGLLTPLWSQEILGDTMNITGKNWIILGKAVAARLRKRIGDVVIVTSILRKEIHILKIVDIRNFNDPRNNYAFGSEELARTLRGIRGEDASIILFKDRAEAMKASRYLGKLYELKISYNIPLQAKLRIIASDGSIISEKRISGSGMEVFKLPLGFYQLIISTGYANLPMESLKLKESKEINIKLNGSVRLTITGFREKPILKDMKGKVIEPQRLDSSWVYEIPIGVYFLKLDNLRLKLPVLTDLKIKPGEIQKIPETYKVRFDMSWIDGRPIREAYLTILTKAGELITAAKVTKSYEIYLPRGEYSIKLVKGGYVLEKNLKINSEKRIKLVMPLRSGGKCPYTRRLKEIKILAAGYDETSMISILALSAELAILTISIILAVVTYISITDHLYESASKELENLKELKLQRKLLLRITYLPVIEITLLGAGLGGLTAFILVKTISWTPSIPLQFTGLSPSTYLTQIVIAFFASTYSYLKEVLRKWS